SAGFFQRGAVVAGGSLRAEQVLQPKLGVAEKFIEKGPAQAFARTAVAGKKRACHFLGQLETEHRSLEVGKERDEACLFVRCELRTHATEFLTDNTRCSTVLPQKFAVNSRRIPPKHLPFTS